MKKNLYIYIFTAIIFICLNASSAFSAPLSHQLRSAIDALECVKINTAQIDNAVLAAYELFRPKLNLAPINLTAEMRFKGFDASKLKKFAERLEKTPSKADTDAARTIIAAAYAVNELAGVSFLLSEDIFMSGYSASAAAFSLAARINRTNNASLINEAAKERIRKLAFNISKGFIGLLTPHMPQRVSQFMPVCLWIAGDICARSLGISSSASFNSGIRAASIKTAGRVVMAFTPEIGFYARTQRLIDELGDAALNSKLAPLTPEKSAIITTEINKIKKQAQKISQISANERNAAGVTQKISELAAVFSAIEPTKISSGLAAAGGALTAGAYIHSFYGPLKKHNDLIYDIHNLFKILKNSSYTQPQSTSATSFAISETAMKAIEAKNARLSSLLKRYAEANFELAELSNNSSGQKEFFLKLKELEKIDYEIGVLSLSK